MIRSTPPASSNFAEMPVPAPPPIIGRSAAMILCSLSRTCLRVNPIAKESERQRTTTNVSVRSLSFVDVHCRIVDVHCLLLNQFKHHFDSFSRERRIIDIKIELYYRNPRLEISFDRVEHGSIRRSITEPLTITVEHRNAVERNQERYWAFRGVCFLRKNFTHSAIFFHIGPHEGHRGIPLIEKPFCLSISFRDRGRCAKIGHINTSGDDEMRNAALPGCIQPFRTCAEDTLAEFVRPLG